MDCSQTYLVPGVICGLWAILFGCTERCCGYDLDVHVASMAIAHVSGSLTQFRGLRSQNSLTYGVSLKQSHCLEHPQMGQDVFVSVRYGIRIALSCHQLGGLDSLGDFFQGLVLEGTRPTPQPVGYEPIGGKAVRNTFEASTC